MYRRGRKGNIGGLTGAAYVPGHRPEMKFKDTVISATALAAAGAVVNAESILTIPQDNTESGRHGRKISLQRIQIKGMFTKKDNSAATDPDLLTPQSYVRFCLVVDHQANADNSGLQPLVYEGLSAGGTGDAGFLSFRNLANTSRFTILKDKVVKLSSDIEQLTDASGNGSSWLSLPSKQKLDVYVKCNIPIAYTGTTGAIGERTNNNLAIIIFSNDVDPTKVTFEGTVRVRYLDY